MSLSPEGGVEHREQQDVVIDNSDLLTNLSILQTARRNLERIFCYSPRGAQKIEKYDDWGGQHRPVPRKKEDFDYGVDMNVVIGAVTREVTKGGKLSLTGKREDQIETEIVEVFNTLADAQKRIKKYEEQFFHNQDLQKQWKAVFSRETINNQEDADKVITRELRPLVKLWQETKVKLLARLAVERDRKKPTERMDLEKEEKEIPQLAAWQITGMDNPLDELSVQKQADFKDMLSRIFLLPGQHQELKSEFFSNGACHCGSAEAVVELLKLYNHKADNIANRIEVDMTLSEIKNILAMAQAVLPEEDGGDDEEFGEFKYNQAEAERLRLERLDLPAYKEADAMVINKTIDITTTEGQQAFLEQWQQHCPNFPPPCVPDKNDWWYLTRLSEEKIIANLSGDKKIIRPHFGERETILVDNWQEEDWDATNPNARTKKLQTIISPLLQELLGQEQVGVVNIKREVVDNALWEGDPGDRVQSNKAKEIIRKLGADPEEMELRCLKQSEHARGSLVRSDWGTKNLYTNYDGYFLEDDDGRNGLRGGYRGYGGVSCVDSDWRDYANEDLAVRLVLARKQK